MRYYGLDGDNDDDVSVDRVDGRGRRKQKGEIGRTKKKGGGRGGGGFKGGIRGAVADAPAAGGGGAGADRRGAGLLAGWLKAGYEAGLGAAGEEPPPSHPSL